MLAEDVSVLSCCSREIAKEEFFSTPFHDHILSKSDCLSEHQCFHEMDIKSVEITDFEHIQNDIEFTIRKVNFFVLQKHATFENFKRTLFH